MEIKSIRDRARALSDEELVKRLRSFTYILLGVIVMDAIIAALIAANNPDYAWIVIFFIPGLLPVWLMRKNFDLEVKSRGIG